LSAIASTSGRVHIVNLCSFYSYRLIWKPTAFLHLQAFRFLNPTSSTTSVRRSPHNSNRKWSTSSPVVRFFIDTQNRLVSLQSVLVKAHEETDISPLSVIYRPIGSTKQCSRINQPNSRRPTKILPILTFLVYI
jgi:hypothetical protein